MYGIFHLWTRDFFFPPTKPALLLFERVTSARRYTHDLGRYVAICPFQFRVVPRQAVWKKNTAAGDTRYEFDLFVRCDTRIRCTRVRIPSRGRVQ